MTMTKTVNKELSNEEISQIVKKINEVSEEYVASRPAS